MPAMLAYILETLNPSSSWRRIVAVERACVVATGGTFIPRLVIRPLALVRSPLDYAHSIAQQLIRAISIWSWLVVALCFHHGP